jgi:hypothetical protein
VVTPDRAALLVVGRFGKRIVHQVVWHAAPARTGENRWQPVLDTLHKNLLPRFHNAGKASITLSNHFCRCALLPNHGGLTRESEIHAYALSKLRSLFGDIAQDWDVQIAAYKDAVLVCGVDRTLLDALRTLFAELQMPAASIQPYFAAAFNRARARFGSRSGWFVVQESGLAVISRFDNGHWTCLTTRRTPDDTPETLMATLAREQRLQLGAGDERQAVWLTSSVNPYEAADFAPLGWDVAVIPQTMPKANLDEDELSYAMAR